MALFKKLIAETRSRLELGRPPHPSVDVDGPRDYGDGDPDPNPEYQRYRSKMVDIPPDEGGVPSAAPIKKQTQWTPEMLKKVRRVP